MFSNFSSSKHFEISEEDAYVYNIVKTKQKFKENKVNKSVCNWKPAT